MRRHTSSTARPREAFALSCFLAAGSAAVSAVLLGGSGCGTDAPTKAEDGAPATSVDDASADATDATSAPPAPPSITEPAPQTIDEEVESTLVIASSGYRAFAAENLPPGALFDPRTGAIRYRPDFTESGDYDVTVTAFAGGPPATTTSTVHVRFTVRDSIAPPPPVVVQTTPLGAFKRLVVRQTTDTFLDSPGHAGRTIEAVLGVPSSATTSKRAAVVLSLHGFSGTTMTTVGNGTTFELAPHDPDNTYWWGYADSLPGAPPSGAAHFQPYTMRRVLHLVDWVIRTYPEADPDRVFSTGGSMGGAGALNTGLLHARHFAGVEAIVAPTVARNHRPSRVKQLTSLWGSPELNLDQAWDTIDVPRMFRDSAEAKNQFVFTRHAKDDSTVHFGAAVFASPITKTSFFASLEQERVGHLTIWDEGSHTTADPKLGGGWWDNDWSRVTDPQSFLNRRLPFPAFTRSSANDDAGDEKGNGKVTFDPESGFAANALASGDTGWGGAIAGAQNRFLRWDASKIIDTRDRLVLPLRVVVSSGKASPGAGFPTKGDLFVGPLPITADVTPRRAQRFLPTPGESVRWRFGEAGGTVPTGADGSVTIRALPLGESFTELVLERDPP